MNFRKNQALWTAVILHIAVLFVLFLGTIVAMLQPQEKLHIFEMVEPASEQSTNQSAATAPVRPPELPAFEPLDIPDPVLAELLSEPKLAFEKPKPAAPVKPKLIPYDQFRKDNPLKKPSKPRKAAPSKVPKVVIQTPKWQILQGNPSSSNQPRAMSAAEQTELQRYGSQLNSRLNGAWNKPANLSGVALTVQVQFDVSSSGRISNIRLRPSSSNATFDRSVLAAFTKVGSGGVTPTGQSHSFTMAFKMVD